MVGSHRESISREVANEIKDLNSKYFKQAEIIKIVNVSKTTVSKVLKGRREFSTNDYLMANTMILREMYIQGHTREHIWNQLNLPNVHPKYNMSPSVGKQAEANFCSKNWLLERESVHVSTKSASDEQFEA